MQTSHYWECKRCVSRYKGECKIRSYCCRVQFLAMCFVKLCKLHWQVEPFFKRFTQHPRINAFFRNSYNAARTQIWIFVRACIRIESLY